MSSVDMSDATMKEAQEDSETDVLPEPVSILLATLWVVLFGGRWLIVPLFQAAGVLSPDTVVAWDEGLLAKAYLILLSITCVVLALRAVRRVQPRSPTGNPPAASALDDTAPHAAPPA